MKALQPLESLPRLAEPPRCQPSQYTMIVYQQAAAGRSGRGETEQPEQAEEKVVDAEYEEVKEDKKE